MKQDLEISGKTPDAQYRITALEYQAGSYSALIHLSGKICYKDLLKSIKLDLDQVVSELRVKIADNGVTMTFKQWFEKYMLRTFGAVWPPHAEKIARAAWEASKTVSYDPCGW